MSAEKTWRKDRAFLSRWIINFQMMNIFLRRCAAEILDDFIPTSRQNGDIIVGVREIFTIDRV
jgi:NADPH-dependent 7-cyano-7-deazaguanine reductase QueF